VRVTPKGLTVLRGLLSWRNALSAHAPLCAVVLVLVLVLLPAAPASASYTGAVGADNPSGWWRLGELSGSTAADASGGAHPGTYAAGVTLGGTGALTASGDSDKSATFSGASTAKVDVPSSTTVWSGTNQLTLETWVWRDDTTTADILIGPTGTAGPVLRAPNGNTSVTFDPNVGGAGGTITWPTALPTGGWHHVAVTFDQVADTATLYVDGLSLGAQAATEDQAASPGNVVLGSRSTGFESLNGHLDEPAVYEAALSAVRIGVHFDEAQAPPPPPSWFDAQTAQVQEGLVNGVHEWLGGSPLELPYKHDVGGSYYPERAGKVVAEALDRGPTLTLSTAEKTALARSELDMASKAATGTLTRGKLLPLFLNAGKVAGWGSAVGLMLLDGTASDLVAGVETTIGSFAFENDQPGQIIDFELALNRQDSSQGRRFGGCVAPNFEGASPIASCIPGLEEPTDADMVLPFSGGEPVPAYIGVQHWAGASGDSYRTWWKTHVECKPLSFAPLPAVTTSVAAADDCKWRESFPPPFGTAMEEPSARESGYGLADDLLEEQPLRRREEGDDVTTGTRYRQVTVIGLGTDPVSRNRLREAVEEFFDSPGSLPIRNELDVDIPTVSEGFTMPECSGMTAAACEAALDALGWTGTFSAVPNATHVPSVEPGRVVTSDPAGGRENVAPDADVVVTINPDPTPGGGAVVPECDHTDTYETCGAKLDLVGYLSHHKVELTPGAYDFDVLPGHWVETSPPGGSEVGFETDIEIRVNPPQEYTRVPAPLDGETYESYTVRLEDIGLLGKIELISDEERDPERAEGSIYSLDPPAGTPVQIGTPVIVRVDPIVPPIIVPGPPGVPPLDFTPLNVELLCSHFPFGVPCWSFEAVREWAAPGDPPEFSIPIHNGDLVFDLAQFEPAMAIVRPVILVLGTLGIGWFFFSFTFGGGGGAGKSDDD
jgi:hypothetical protein